ncbi:MAG: hypothetical protein ACFFE1_02700 [Candidatus Thorarchaeota archaeon]
MKKSNRLTITIVVCTLIVMIAGAYSALGRPSQSNECNACHNDTLSLMTISSNATGTVNAKVGIQFSLVIDAASLVGDAVGGSMAVKVSSGWADNNQFSFVDPTTVIDNGVGDSNANDVQITTTIAFTPLAVGTWTLRIWTAAGKSATIEKVSQKLDVSVSVTLSDTTPPTIDSPSDMIISEGDVTKNITWSPSDANPSSYELFDDSVSWQSGSWDGSPITAQLSSLGLGTHNITLEVWDTAGNSASDQVNVTVLDGTPPSIDSPANVTYSEGVTGFSITWDPTDDHPSGYIIYREGVSVKSGTWNTSIETISIIVDGLAVGTYNYTIIVTDVGSNTAIDTVYVIVYDATNPTIDSPADVLYDEGTTGHSISWNPSDLNPVSYVIYKDGVPVKSGSWNSSLETISISVDGLAVGSYSYVLEVTDIGSNNASDTVLVIVSDGTFPTIDSPLDITYNEGATGYSITWNPSDLNPQNYTIYRDGSPVKTGLWNSSSESISISVDGLAMGSYTYMIVVEDVGKNKASDSVLINVVDGTDPTIDTPVDRDVVEGTSGNQIVWSPYDLHPSSYEIYRDGALIISRSWNSSSETIVFSIDGLSLGVYNVTIVVFDTTSRTAIDTVFVTVYDGTPPLVDHPADIDYPDGDSGYSITWSPSDLHPVSYQILREGVQVKSGTWNSSSETMTISVDELFIGSYNYTIVLLDIGGNVVTDEVIVTVYNADLPTIDQPANQTIYEGVTGLFVTWNPLDLNPSSYAVYMDGVLVKSGAWNSSVETISISLDGLTLGSYNFTALVTDLDSNTAEDTVWVTVVDGTPPVLDSPTDITYDEGNPGGTLTWSPSDTHPISYVIYLDDSPIKSGAWNSSGEFISISVSGHLVGDFNYTIWVVDIGGNVDVDTVFVYVLDGTPPTIDSPIDINYNEGDAGGSITWDPADTYPDSYEIYQNDVLVKTGLWNSTSETISMSVNGLSYGLYNYTIKVYDIGGNTVSDIVWVTVSDATPPTIDAPIDMWIDEGQTGEQIVWSPDDLNPSGYEIYQNNVLVKTGLWNSTSETISISLDGLNLGVHNFTLVVTDVDSNTANDTVYVTISDGTDPTIDSPPDVFYDEGVQGNSITWDPSDLHPANYEIFREGVQVKTGLWNSSVETISINVDGLALGTYNFTIFVLDTGGNLANDTVFVHVSDGSAPTIDSPPDVFYNEGETGYTIVWSPSDTHPSVYELFREGVLIASGPWNSSSETFNVSVDGHQVGSYNYTLRVVDVGGSDASDTVFVYVQDGTDPIIDSPDDIIYTEGETGHSISWSPVDLNPVSYEIFRDGILVKSGAWNSSGEVISISVDGLSPGEYNFTVSVTDVGSNSVVDQVNVTVEAAATTSTLTPTSSSTQTTPTETPTPPPFPMDQFLIVILTWVGTSIIILLVAEAIIRKTR